MATGFGDFTHRMELLAKEMDGRALKARLTKVGVLSKADINEAVRNDLGDMSMSGWRRGNPHEIVGRFDIEGTVLAMTPAKRSRGPMRVLQQGRNNWGEGVRPARRSRPRMTRRDNGVTQGKDTWTDATKIMERKMPERYVAQLDIAIAKFIKGRR